MTQIQAMIYLKIKDGKIPKFNNLQLPPSAVLAVKNYRVDYENETFSVILGLYSAHTDIAAKKSVDMVDGGIFMQIGEPEFKLDDDGSPTDEIRVPGFQHIKDDIGGIVSNPSPILRAAILGFSWQGEPLGNNWEFSE